VFTGWPLLLGYYCIPWISIDGRQAVWFDLPEREFHILRPDLLAPGLPAACLPADHLGLHAVRGHGLRRADLVRLHLPADRLDQSIFMWVEQKFEGTRNQRIKLDKQPWSVARRCARAASTPPGCSSPS
jgi:hypothetical protein